MAGKVRPLGVSILAILHGLGGILCIIGAVVVGALFAVLTEMTGELAGPFGAMFAAIGLAIAIFLGVLGIFALLVAYGLWTGKGWAWFLTIVLSIIGIIVGILSLPSGIVSIIIDALIIYYMTRPHVKEFFGKGAPPPPPPPPPP